MRYQYLLAPFLEDRWIDESGQPTFALLTEEEIFGEKNRRRRLNRAQIQAVGNSLEDLNEGDACSTSRLWDWTVHGFDENPSRYF